MTQKTVTMPKQQPAASDLADTLKELHPNINTTQQASDAAGNLAGFFATLLEIQQDQQAANKQSGQPREGKPSCR